MNAATLTTVRDRHNQGPNGDRVIAEAFAADETVDHPQTDTHIADPLVELINAMDRSAVAS
jgi:hypothetical protein